MSPAPVLTWTTPIKLDPDTVYAEQWLRIHGLFDEDALAKARGKGLKSREVNGERVYLGRWLLAWLEGEAHGH